MSSVEALWPKDIPDYTALRLKMLTTDPWAFGSSPESDRGLDVENLQSMLQFDWYQILGVRVGDSLVGVAGIIRAQKTKAAHRCGVWGVYVDPDARGQGHGRALMESCLQVARSWPGVDYVDLGVSANSPPALALYTDLGFEVWGREPDATDIDGQRYDELHLTLRL